MVIHAFKELFFLKVSAEATRSLGKEPRVGRVPKGREIERPTFARKRKMVVC